MATNPILLWELPAFLPGGLLASNQTSDEFHETLQRLHGGFFNEEFLLIFRNGLPICLVAIDEAHFISEWSHNFRPLYLRLLVLLLRRKLNVQYILAMNATATTQTLEEMGNLQLSISTSNRSIADLLLLKSSPFVDMKETGHAGRDGRLSYCHILLDSTTFYKSRSLNVAPSCSFTNFYPYQSHGYSSMSCFSGEISFELKDPACIYISKLDAMFDLANFAVKGCHS
ncbi:hypothetical protein BDA96_06G140700, partial [Sorghum bicolor]